MFTSTNAHLIHLSVAVINLYLLIFCPIWTKISELSNKTSQNVNSCKQTHFHTEKITLHKVKESKKKSMQRTRTVRTCPLQWLKKMFKFLNECCSIVCPPKRCLTCKNIKCYLTFNTEINEKQSLVLCVTT